VARQRVARMNVPHVTLLNDQFESLSLDSNSVDVTFFSQSLHHLADPESGLREAVRILKKSGKVLIMELAPHHENWVLKKLGHARLGFEQDELKTMMEHVGLTQLNLELIPANRGDLFRVILASGTK